MSDYPVEIDGRYDLAQINLQIAGEEAGASEFRDSHVTVRNTRATNIATFRTLPSGTVLKPLTIVEQGGPQPPGTDRTWAGVMVVGGSNMAVVGYRAR